MGRIDKICEDGQPQAAEMLASEFEQWLMLRYPYKLASIETDMDTQKFAHRMNAVRVDCSRPNRKGLAGAD